MFGGVDRMVVGVLLWILLFIALFIGIAMYLILRSTVINLAKCPGSTDSKCSILFSDMCCSAGSILVRCSDSECACTTKVFQFTPVCEAMIPTTEGDRIWMKVVGSIMLIFSCLAGACWVYMAVSMCGCCRSHDYAAPSHHYGGGRDGDGDRGARVVSPPPAAAQGLSDDELLSNAASPPPPRPFGSGQRSHQGAEL